MSPVRKKNIFVIAVGSSMSPIINNGDRVLIENDNFSINVGDCYLIYQKNIFIIHRVVSILDRKVMLIGDSSNEFHSVIKKRIFGKVVFNEPPTYRVVTLFFNKLYAKFEKSYIIKGLRRIVNKFLTWLFYGKREIRKTNY